MIDATPAVHRDDPVRAHTPVSGRRSEARHKVRLRAAWPFVDGGHLFGEGWTECILYKSDIERIRAERMSDAVQVADGHWRTDETKIEEAQRLFELGKSSFLETINGPLAADGRRPVAWEEIAHEYEGPRTWQALYIQRNFAYANAAGYKTVGPLREIQVDAEELPPLMVESERMQLATVTALTRAMAAGGTDIGKLLAEVESLRAELDELRASRRQK